MWRRSIKQNISSLQKWAETSCEIIRTGAVFEECREVVSNVDEFYANCVYDSCRSQAPPTSPAHVRHRCSTSNLL